MKAETKSIRRWLLVTLLIGGASAAGATWLSARATAQEGTELAKFMRKKLDASTQILEGLTTKDSRLIRKGTDTLLQMSKAEMWNVLTDANYREFNGEFRSALRKLDEAAQSENFDNALLQWFDGVKGCVECHKYVRDERVKLKK